MQEEMQAFLKREGWKDIRNTSELKWLVRFNPAQSEEQQNWNIMFKPEECKK